MFWHMLYFAVGQRWHLNAEDSCPCFCFPCDTDSNLCDTGVWRWWHFMWNAEFLGLWRPVLMHFPSLSSPWWSTSGCAAWAYIFTEHQSHLEGKYTSMDKIGSVSVWMLSGEYYNSFALVILFRRDVAGALCQQILKYLPLKGASCKGSLPMESKVAAVCTSFIFFWFQR